MARTRVAVALSGGLDSSVAALLLRKEACEVMGLHMRLQDSPASDDQARRAGDICRALGIAYDLVDLQEEFEAGVIDYFCREYRQGRTPNPCVACNRHVKFGYLLDRALSLGADYLATGHYARVEHSENRHRLLRAVDARRDQSYFLYTLTQPGLRHILFPLGGLGRDEVKRMAEQAGLPTTARSSQDVCFISKRRRGDFLEQRVPARPGDVVDAQGSILGQHRGISLYTVGQRHGLGLSGDRPLYIIRIEPEHNRIVLGPEQDLYSRRLTADKLNWISGKAPDGYVRAGVRIRYRSREAGATLCFKHDAVDVDFDQPQKAVTPGQAVVFYDKDEVLGGGTIESAERGTPAHA
jgi:tRNA-uridine 2-sulfurtransferase